MLDKVLYGKKTILFEFRPDDMEHFVRLHREDTKGYLQQYSLYKMTKDEAVNYVSVLLLTKQINIYSVFTKEGKASKRIGFIYLTDLNSFSCELVGIMDKEVAKGVVKKIRIGKWTFSQDALSTILRYCFNDLKLKRIETRIAEPNRRAIKLVDSLGFVKEGLLRKALKLDNDVYINIVCFSILSEDYNGKKQDWVGANTGVQQPNTSVIQHAVGVGVV